MNSKKYKKITGAKYALGVGNGTDALYLCLKASDIEMEMRL